MGKRLRVRDRLLLGAAISGDLFFEFVQPLSFQLKKMRGILPPDYKLTNFTASVSRMMTTGYIEKVIRHGEPYLRLTGKGLKALVRDYPIFNLKNQKWDSKWRMVFYDIPDKKKSSRDGLKSKLKELGFGMIQESIYISPYDIAQDLAEFIEAQNLSEFVFVGEVNKLLIGNRKQLAERIWGLEKLNDRYFNLMQKINNQKQTDNIISDYEEVLREDPCLPKELLPDDWLGDRVHKEIKKLL